MYALDVETCCPPSPPLQPIATLDLPDGVIFARCVACHGNVLASEGELACLMCGRTLLPLRTLRTPSGILRVVEVTLAAPPPPLAPTSIGHMAARRVTRTLARDAGTSRAASVLRTVPWFPELITASKVSRALSLSKGEVEQTLGELVGARKVRRAIYEPVHFYEGYYRPRLSS